MDSFDLLVELVIWKKRVIRNLLSLFHASDNLDHNFRILLYDIFANLMFAKKFGHFGS